MELSAFRRELVRLMKDVKARTEGNRTDYTKGYLDALRYAIEWIDEYE